MVDTTIPGVSAEIVEPDIARPLGVAGRIAVVGKFEKGDANTAYFFDNPRSAGRVLGTSASYSGSNILNYIFKQDTESNNYGATGCICVKAGASVAASKTLIDGSSAVVHTYTARGAGTWANGATGGLKYTIAAGTLSISGTWKFTLKLNDVVVETYDNATPTELKNRINAYSQYITCASGVGTVPVAVTDQAFASGTETASPTSGDLTAALAVLAEEEFDILIFTDAPDPAYYPTLKTWLNSKLALDKPCMAFLPVATSNSVAQAIAVAATADNQLINYIHQYFTMGEDTLTLPESVARYAGFVAGLPVNDSPTNKIINDIDGLNTNFSTANQYDLTSGGVTVLALKNRENSKYGVVGAVTGSLAVTDTGQKTDSSELHAVRTLVYVLNYLNLDLWLGQTGISKTIDSIEGELSNRVSTIVDSDVVDASEDIVIEVAADPDNAQMVDVDISVRPKGILKHIHKRIKLVAGGS